MLLATHCQVRLRFLYIHSSSQALVQLKPQAIPPRARQSKLQERQRNTYAHVVQRHYARPVSCRFNFNLLRQREPAPRYTANISASVSSVRPLCHRRTPAGGGHHLRTAGSVRPGVVRCSQCTSKKGFALLPPFDFFHGRNCRVRLRQLHSSPGVMTQLGEVR